MAGFFDASCHAHTVDARRRDVIKRDRVVDKLARDVNVNCVTSSSSRHLDSVPPRALSPTLPHLQSPPATTMDSYLQLPLCSLYATSHRYRLTAQGPPLSSPAYAPCIVSASVIEHLPPSPSPTLLTTSPRDCLLNPIFSNPTPFRLPTHSHSLPLSFIASIWLLIRSNETSRSALDKRTPS
ncbi:hypothetical protein R3P38DRAFT_3260888 [Favolaschia claudopus]|uniref:Uncharacterized protein n=1 Tax=Favolaschia claudopus TaxID=2862362 RepID=A0AAW0CRC8_9AGAR